MGTAPEALAWARCAGQFLRGTYPGRAECRAATGGLHEERQAQRGHDPLENRTRSQVMERFPGQRHGLTRSGLHTGQCVTHETAELPVAAALHHCGAGRTR